MHLHVEFPVESLNSPKCLTPTVLLALLPRFLSALRPGLPPACEEAVDGVPVTICARLRISQAWQDEAVPSCIGHLASCSINLQTIRGLPSSLFLNDKRYGYGQDLRL